MRSTAGKSKSKIALDAERQLRIFFFYQYNLHFEAGLNLFEKQMSAFLHPHPLQTTVGAFESFQVGECSDL